MGTALYQEMELNLTGVNFQVDTPIEDDFTIIIIANTIHTGAGGGGGYMGAIGVIGDQTDFGMAFGNGIIWHGVHDTGTQAGVDENTYMSQSRSIQLFQRNQSEGWIKFSAHDPTPDRIKTGISTDPIDTTTTYIGSTGVNGAYNSSQINGHIHEVMIFDEVLTEDQLIKLYAYLASKWSFRVATDSDGDGVEDGIELAVGSKTYDASDFPVGPKIVTINQTLSHQLVQDSPFNNTYTSENLPAWALIDETTGIISGSPTIDDIGFYTDIVITVTNENGVTELDPFDMWVTDPEAHLVLTYDVPENGKPSEYPSGNSNYNRRIYLPVYRTGNTTTVDVDWGNGSDIIRYTNKGVDQIYKN